jgi:predicted  nucleic acid-binding Zn-ribbon protein
MGLLRKNLARKAAKADARVAALTQESTQLQLRRSQAQTAIAQLEVERLRADLDALQARYTALEQRAAAPLPEQAHRRST